MRQETLLTGRSGRLNGRLWTADQDPRGVVVAIHGLGDHSGRYQSLARALTTECWSLLAFDFSGHGLSPGARGRVDSFEGLLTDIACARQTARERFGSLPQVLLGHSMGGNLAINYVLRRHEIQPHVGNPVGLVLSAPMLLPPSPPPRPHIFAAWLTGHLFPWLRVHRPVDAAALTTDGEQAIAIASDPLMHSRISVYLATQLLSQGRWALDHARQVDIPTLILCGDDDELIDKSVCENLPIRIGSLATPVRFAEKRHDLFHEQGSDEVFDCLTRWLRQIAR